MIKLNSYSLFGVHSVNESPVEMKVFNTGRVGDQEGRRILGREVDGLAGSGREELIAWDTAAALLQTDLIAEELS